METTNKVIEMSSHTKEEEILYLYWVNEPHQKEIKKNKKKRFFKAKKCSLKNFNLPTILIKKIKKTYNLRLLENLRV